VHAGHRHWGRFGAAGLLAVTQRPSPGGRRTSSCSTGRLEPRRDTWACRAGRAGSTESALVAAQRETVEETGIDVAQLVPGRRARRRPRHLELHDDRRDEPVRLPVVPDRESIALRWVPVDEVTSLPLLPAFAAAWPALLQLLP
jgi:8-oxo-dGTP pyrophosphatase MutT (NUDIX family)